MRKNEPKHRDPGVQAAIDAADGVGNLAKLLGIKSPSVSGWSRVPADRVIEIERGLRGKVTREQMRPDLYPAEEKEFAA
jgi:DNA-binding transcriptional regulator YdaS (Cro superfamily)